MDMRRALKDRLANYKIPQELKVLEDGLPRNAMGKSKCLIASAYPCKLLFGHSLISVRLVNKKSLVKEVFGDADSS